MFKDYKIKNFLSVSFVYISIYSATFNINADSNLKSELLKKIAIGIPQWMDQQISKDLSHVPGEGITKRLIEETMKNSPAEIALYRIKDGVLSVHTTHAMSQDTKNLLCNPIAETLAELNSYVKLPDVEFLHFVWDSPSTGPNGAAFNAPHVIFSNYQIPVFASCKILEEKNVVLFPDPWTLKFIKDGSLDKTKLGNSTYPWSQKISKAIWRGMTTGGSYYKDIYQRFPRVKLVQLSNNFPEILDAKFNTIYGDYYVKSIFPQLNYMGETLPIEDHMQYKYQILIDGNSAPWTRGFWQLHCNSVILKQTSNYIQWYYELLKPYVHYIPFDYHCTDLIEKIRWAQNNEDKVLEIIKNANSVAENCLQYSDILLYMYAVINKYAKLQAFKP